MKRLVVVSGMLLTLYSFAVAQNAADRSEDEAAIRAVIANLGSAWAKGDARLYGEQFAEDADFTVWNGTYVKGREAITRGHDEIFKTVYKGTKARVRVRSIRFLRDDVAVAHYEATAVKEGEEFPPTPQAVPVAVLTKEKGKWRIAVLQSTAVQPRQGARQ